MSAAPPTRARFLRRLAGVMPGPRPDLKVTVLEERLRRDEGRWCVPVTIENARGETAPLGVYVNVLAIAELRACDELGLDVFFVPCPAGPLTS